ncbi:hypothetical protein [Leisingera sp. ANG59]|uniref:hypothetical protein n=1 Tax=Leisingera sp. ANG59 TaxID=2675221 RepID=UPI0015748645|nr:hypothetical protein [Leisingera sp. ANG59]NSY36821.1 hypothetical protein [Leisingera sp. ANG59]
MRQFALMIALSCTVAPVWGGEWRSLSGEEVQAALEGQRLVYGSGAWQEFNASGRTLYNAGHDSWGYWGVRDGKYCSTWPPSDLWASYALESDGEALRFVGEGGDITTGRYAEPEE